MVNYNVIEKDYVDNYNEMKKAYLNGVRGERFRKLFGIGRSAYKRILQDFREDGIFIAHRGKVKVGSKPKYYYFANYYGYGYWVVRRTINGERHNFGHFKSEAEAQQKVRELDSNGWEGLL